jgi:hypothetical protein
LKKHEFDCWKKAEKVESKETLCQFEGCVNKGLYKAPKSNLSSDQKQPDNWLWFCIDHIRDYNASWNYFKDMSEEEIWREWRRDITWQRPTWPLGSWHTRRNVDFEHGFSSKKNTRNCFDDPFGIFSDWHETSRPNNTIHDHNSPEAEAMSLLEISFPFDAHQLQIAYRKLVKKFHPDLNQGCLKSEEKLKSINHAYTILKQNLLKGQAK